MKLLLSALAQAETAKPPTVEAVVGILRESTALRSGQIGQNLPHHSCGKCHSSKEFLNPETLEDMPAHHNDTDTLK